MFLCEQFNLTKPLLLDEDRGATARVSAAYQLVKLDQFVNLSLILCSVYKEELHSLNPGHYRSFW